MALVTLTDYVWTLGGKVRVNVTYDDANLDVRSATIWNEAQGATRFVVTRTSPPIRTEEFSVPGGTIGQTVNVQPNRYQFGRDAETGDVFPLNFSLQVQAPVA